MLEPTRLGTAILQRPEVFERRHPESDGAFWIGRSPFAADADAVAAWPDDGQGLGIDDDTHVLLLGGTGKGKGATVIVPNLCLWPGSVVCLDPKGENAMLTADARSEGRNGHPQDVYVLDPFHIARIENDRLRASFNPLWELMEPDPDGEDYGRPGDDDYEPAMYPGEDAAEEAQTLASAIVVDGDKGSNNEFWNTSARRMISALILHVITHPRFRGRRNLVTVRELLMNGDDGLTQMARANGDSAGAQALLWNHIALNYAYDGVIRESGSMMAELLANDAETFFSVHATAAAHTEFLISPKIRASLKQSSFRLERLKTDPRGISLYLCLEQRYIASEYYRWLRMVIGLVTQQMEKTKGNCACGHKTLMVLDEFLALRNMPSLEDTVLQGRGHALKIFFAVQSLERLEKNYPKGWQTFVGQCSVRIFFDASDLQTLEYVSKLAGETEVRIATDSETATDTLSGGWSLTETVNHSTSQAEGDTTGTTHGVADATNWNKSQADGQTHTENRGESAAFTEGGATTKSFGRTVTRGSSISRTTWHSLLFGQQFDPVSTVTTSQSVSDTEGMAFTDSWSRQQSTNRGTADGVSKTLSVGEGGGRTISDGTNAGHSSTRTLQAGDSQARGTTGGEAHAKAIGTSWQWHKRPLFSPEEVKRFFAKKDPADPRYPGLALVMFGGDETFVVRRSNYYEDERFIGLFNPHKDYPFVPYRKKLPEPPAEAEQIALAPPVAGADVFAWIAALLLFVAMNVAALHYFKPAAVIGTSAVLLVMGAVLTITLRRSRDEPVLASPRQPDALEAEDEQPTGEVLPPVGQEARRGA